MNSLRIHSATVNTHEGVAIAEFVVSPLFGSPPEAGLLRQQFVGALNGDVDLLGALEKRDTDAAGSAMARAGEIQAVAPLTRSTAPPRILWLDAAAPGHLVIEVRAMDRIGLLALLAQALERAGADIAWAKVNTFGSTAADVFCVTMPDGSLDGQSTQNGDHSSAAHAQVEKQLLAVLGASADAVVDGPVTE
jgi:[protein-PII] uridylyltransferase